MLSLHLSKSVTEKIIDIFTLIFRLVAGGTFIFSGFVKVVDPWGTIYKMGEYLSAMHLEIGKNLIVAGVFALCIYEFIVGVSLLLGCYRKSAPWLALIFMAVMLPLTLWIAVSDPVADCGCFGDALLLSNWATFWKNVILTAVVIWLIRFNRRLKCIIIPAFQWMQVVASGAFMLAIGVYGYTIQPMIDFRAYKVGTDLIDIVEDDDEEVGSFTFIYEKDGRRRTFTENDELPDDNSGWQFVERIEQPGANKSRLNRSLGQMASERNLRIWSEDSEDDVTESVLDPDGDRLLLMIPDLNDISIAQTWKINSMYDWAVKNNIDMIGIASGNKEEVERWRDLSMPAYELYMADDTSIKEVVRGNPGVVFTRDGKVMWKSTLGAIPADDFLQNDTPLDPMQFRHDDRRVLINITMLYIAVLAVLMVLSLLPGFGKMLVRQGRRPVRRASGREHVRTSESTETEEIKEEEK